MEQVKQTTTSKGKRSTFIWMNGVDFKKYSPIRQCYGIIFNDKNEILIGRRVGSKSWTIPGGTPEGNETCLETLKRELIEEVDVEVVEAKELGVQKAFEPGHEEEAVYQVRYVVTKFNLLDQTPDPDGDNMWERKFVPMNKITEYIKWGKTGEAMFKDAISLTGSYY